MNVDDLAKLIRDGLTAASVTTVPVVMPGTPTSKLPAVVLAPSRDTLGDGNRTLRYGFDVVVMVPRGGQVAQYPRLCELEAIVVHSLIPSAVRFDADIEFAATGGADTGEPPAMSRIIAVSFASDIDLCAAPAPPIPPDVSTIGLHTNQTPGASFTATESRTYGTQFFSDEPISIVAIRFWSGPGLDPPTTVGLYDAVSSALYESAPVVGPFVDGWNDVAIPPVSIPAATHYIAAAYRPAGTTWPYTDDGASSSPGYIDNPPLRWQASLFSDPSGALTRPANFGGWDVFVDVAAVIST